MINFKEFDMVTNDHLDGRTYAYIYEQRSLNLKLYKFLKVEIQRW